MSVCIVDCTPPPLFSLSVCQSISFDLFLSPLKPFCSVVEIEGKRPPPPPPRLHKIGILILYSHLFHIEGWIEDNPPICIPWDELLPLEHNLLVLHCCHLIDVSENSLKILFRNVPLDNLQVSYRDKKF